MGSWAWQIRTLLETVPEVAGESVKPEVRWRGPDGRMQDGSAALLVSNNPYRFGAAIGAGTRPRLDQGLLGAAAVGAPGDDSLFRSWTVTSFDVEADGPVPAGLDGEAVVFEPPLRFRIRREALRCRIAHHHPGASPSAVAPEHASAAIRALLDIAAGRDLGRRDR